MAAKPLLRKWGTVVTVAMLALGVVLLAFLASGWKLVPVLSGSMRPTMDAGDAALVSPVRPENVKVGDVVVIAPNEDPNSPVIHRVSSLTRNADGWTAKTKGDANSSVDTWTSNFGNKDLLRERVTFPFIGYIVAPMALIDEPAQMARIFIIVSVIAALLVVWHPWFRRDHHRLGTA